MNALQDAGQFVAPRRCNGGGVCDLIVEIYRLSRLKRVFRIAVERVIDLSPPKRDTGLIDAFLFSEFQQIVQVNYVLWTQGANLGDFFGQDDGGSGIATFGRVHQHVHSCLGVESDTIGATHQVPPITELRDWIALEREPFGHLSRDMVAVLTGGDEAEVGASLVSDQPCDALCCRQVVVQHEGGQLVEGGLFAITGAQRQFNGSLSLGFQRFGQ
ncbi:hypothetical protein [Roseovarius pelagicus]|uniref:Uncharacterized protein n=1 Tax=Roseovarius pelagicus TaxID=2980108 RepID=A0ABY6DHM5_9RHOB|nr:hypothetical protein [Roseovarius pelagicus]UXX83315.1 hypothetical protein N7U68_01115 [Roseovarius pelagicus]